MAGRTVQHGRCACGHIHYSLQDAPLFVHACHCTCCQTESGSAFALNGIIEAHRVTLHRGRPQEVLTPTPSGNGQIFARCPICRIALWSIYSGAGPRFFFVRLGTLDDTSGLRPDIHIYTSTKQPWLDLSGADVPVMAEYYRRSEQWPADSLARRDATLALTDEAAAGPLVRADGD